MIDQIKNMALMLLATLALLLGVWGGIVSYQFTKYKESVNDQVQLAKTEKQRIETQHKREYNDAQTGYNSALDILGQRLRNAKTVSRPGCVPVADKGGTGGTMPEGARDTAGTVTAIATRSGTCESSFYADALITTQRCKHLIEYLK